ncbi:MAG: SRPBCC family protein [Pedobacter sp.]|nr:SRPBCC family protein [Pedobacter sp.]MDQ8052078.1 SRPBCC family protein [Pedobacter sp.]
MTAIKLKINIEAPIQVVFDCARSIDVHQLSTAKTNEKAIAGKTSGLCELGDQVTWSAKHFGIYQTLSSRITKMKIPFYFQDCMIKGAFTFIKHDHYFQDREGLVVMEDTFQYGVPYGFVGKLFDQLVLKRYLTNLLTKRNLVIKAIAETGAE